MESTATTGKRARTFTTTAALVALLGLVALPSGGCASDVLDEPEPSSAHQEHARPEATQPAAEAPAPDTSVARAPDADASAAQAPAEPAKPAEQVKEITLNGQPALLTGEQVSVASGTVDGGTIAMRGESPAPAQQTATAPAHRPPTLDTGYDLSKLQVPVTTPIRSGTTAENAFSVAAQQPEEHDHASHDHGDEAAVQHEGPFGKIVWGPEGNEHDFGDLIQGAVRAHTFEFTNEGEGELVIDKIKPSCGCTVAQTMIVAEDGTKKPYVVGQPLPVGAHVEVTPRVNTRGKSGRLHSNVNIFCNDERGVVTISLMGTVKPFFTVEPPHLNFNQVHAGDTVEGSVKVTSAMADRFKLTYDETILPPEMTVELTPVDPDESGAAGEWTLHVKLAIGDQEGMRSHPIKLLSDQPMQVDTAGTEEVAAATPAVAGNHETMVYVMATVTGVVEVNPRYMSFSMMRPGQSLTKSVQLEAHDEGFTLPEPQVSVVGYRGDFELPDCVTLETTPAEDGQTWQVSLTVHDLPEDLNSSFRGKVVIQTGNEKKPTIEVPFSGVCRPGVDQAQTPVPQQPGAGAAGSGH